MYCVKCGRVMDEGEKFCKQCGWSVQLEAEDKPQKVEKSQSAASRKKIPKYLIAIVIGLGLLIGIGMGLMIFLLGNSSETPSTIENNLEQIPLEEQTEETITESHPQESAKIIEETPKDTVTGMPQTMEEFKATCVYCTYEELARNPLDYKGEAINLYGEVIQVMENGNEVQLRVNITQNEYSWEDPVYVAYTRKDEKENRILEDDMIQIWGVSNGTINYETVMGNNLTVPFIEAAYIEIEEVVEEEEQIYNDVYSVKERDSYNSDYTWQEYYVLPYSDIYYLEDEDLNYLSEEELCIARNEIYARHGRMFVTDKIQDYFSNQPWYYPSIPADQFTESMLTEIEHYNIAMIQEYEKKFE